jgi:hypothetical protein
MAGRENERETKRGWNSHFPAYGWKSKENQTIEEDELSRCPWDQEALEEDIERICLSTWPLSSSFCSVSYIGPQLLHLDSVRLFFSVQHMVFLFKLIWFPRPPHVG